MNVLIIGSGGREHALAWKIAQSPRLTRLYIAPGNAGTSQIGKNVSIPISGADGFRGLIAFCREYKIGLVVIGPEIPLAEGLVDSLAETNIPTFGPSRAATQIEASKSFAKAFMERHKIPTARFATFDDYEAALLHMRKVNYPVVIKASGLAGGKGVLLPDTPQDAEAALWSVLVSRQFGPAGEEVIIEERLEGEEVSVLAFSDGKSLRIMPPAQDHKRLLDDDQGPNTGGMGAYAPAPICPPEMLEEIHWTILEPTVNGMQAEGMPFVGVLYAGLMITSHGPKVLEFNARFGDPETQALMPLLDSDLLDILDACACGCLDTLDVNWKGGASACVVAAAQGYPGKVAKGAPIPGLETTFQNAFIFHAGTRRDGEQTVTDGGRVLSVTGWGADLSTALKHAYAAVEKVAFPGIQFRRDIGWRALARLAQSEKPSAYSNSGVDIDAGNRAVKMMSKAVRSTYGPEVLAGIGAFGGLFDGSILKTMDSPVLVASTDGVGTKTKLAAQAKRYASIGHDIVNHCTNDILVQGARPLFFLDYFASSKLRPEIVAEIVGGMAAACREVGCALLGGETAEMPGVYAAREFDVVGTMVGVVERNLILPHSNIQAGDILLGLRSSGPHTNGYSLIRRIFANTSIDTVFPELGIPLSEALLTPHRSYLKILHPILTQYPDLIKGLAHITGGGLVENLPRVLPEGVQAIIHSAAWPVPPLFQLIQSRGKISEAEMYRVFNMGIGMIIIINPENAIQLRQLLPTETEVYEIGKLITGIRRVILD